MKNYEDFKPIKEKKIVPVTHYCIKNAKGEDVEVKKGQHDYEITDDNVWHHQGKYLNEYYVEVYSQKQQFLDYVCENIDSILDGTYADDFDIYPQFNAEFTSLKELCKLNGLSIQDKFPAIIQKLSKSASNFNAKRRKWLNNIDNSREYDELPEEVQNKIKKYKQS